MPCIFYLKVKKYQKQLQLVQFLRKFFNKNPLNLFIFGKIRVLMVGGSRKKESLTLTMLKYLSAISKFVLFQCEVTCERYFTQNEFFYGKQ